MKSLTKMIKSCYWFLALLLFFGKIYGQEEAMSAAKKAQNPLANIISLPLQNNTDFGVGAFDGTANTLNIQPVLPITLGKNNLTLINRFIIPFPKTVPDLFDEEGSNTTGLGDITYTAYLAPAPKKNITVGLGAVTIWPTASDPSLGSDKFSIGPSGVFVYMTPKFMTTAIVSQWWSVGGNEDAANVSTLYFQYILSYFFESKWYLTSAPINLFNWEASEGQKATIPIGGGGGKLFKLGKLPVDATVQAYYYASKPDFGPDWQLRAQFKIIFPTGGNKKSN